MSYPHGAVDRRVRDAVFRAGYRWAACSHFDANPYGRDPLLLCRLVIFKDDSERTMLNKINGDWDWLRWRSIDPAIL